MLQLRIKLIKQLDRKEIKQKEVVFLLDVSRQTVSKWLAKFRAEGEAGLIPKKSGPKDGSAWNRTKEEKEDLICKIAEDNPFKGPDWINDQLDFKINNSTIYRVLKRKKIRYYQGYKHTRRKKKAYCLDKPGRELQLDTCFPFGYSRREVVYDAIDDCSRFVFARVMPNHEENTTILFLQELIKKCPFKIEAIRTDQGREFSKKVTKFLKSQGIEHKKNPPYTPQHNGKIERYHRTFKEESAYYWDQQASQEELNYNLQHWLYHYNFRKKHTGLGMPQPRKFFTPLLEIPYSQHLSKM